MKQFISSAGVFWCIRIIVCYNYTNILDKSKEGLDFTDNFIPTSIIANYLCKYFDGGDVLVSISSTSLSDEQQDHQTALLNDLISEPKFSKFSYNILDHIDQSSRGNHKIVNLIFIDESESLM